MTQIKRYSGILSKQRELLNCKIDIKFMLIELVQQIERGMTKCQHTIEFLMDVYINAQEGIIQPPSNNIYQRY